jgi:hypothetical protein
VPVIAPGGLSPVTIAGAGLARNPIGVIGHAN